MELSILDVEKVAKLARLSLSESDKIKFTEQLKGILNYVNTLSTVNTDDVNLDSITESTNISMREDISVQSLAVTSIMNNAPDSDGKFFKVKKVID